MASGTRSNDESSPILPIGELIRAERERSGLSYRELAGKAEAAGYSVKFQYLNALVNDGPKSWPKHPDTFRGLSVALHLPVREIVLSYAVSLGLDVGGTEHRLATGLPESAGSLSPEVTEALLALIRTLADPQDGGATPTTAGELELAADSSQNRGKELHKSIAVLGEGTQEIRKKR